MQADPTAKSASPEVIAQVRAVLDDQLLDYPSTRFRSVYLKATSANSHGFCGEINARNRLGGFSGWTPFFIVVGDQNTATLEGSLVMAGTPTPIDHLADKYGPPDQSPAFTGGPPRDSSVKVISSHCGGEATNLDEHDYSADLFYSHPEQ